MLNTGEYCEYAEFCYACKSAVSVIWSDREFVHQATNNELRNWRRDGGIIQD